MSYDILIRGGMLYDGSCKAPVVADVAVAEGRIAEIGYDDVLLVKAQRLLAGAPSGLRAFRVAPD